MSTSLEDIGETDKVAVYICTRIFKRVTHSGLGGKIYYDIEGVI